LGYCDIGILGYWDIGILGYWDIAILRYWDIGMPFSGSVLRLSLDDGKVINNLINFLVTFNCHNPAQLNTKLGWLYTLLINSALATARTINHAMPHSTPIYWGSKATPIFLAAPQSTLVFFGNLLFSSALATTTPDNLAIPHSTPIYWGRKATPIFLATPQSTLVFFGTKSHFYLTHTFSLPCFNPVY
jgi:hypothetical protein